MTGFCPEEDLRDKPEFPEEKVDYELVKEYKDTLFHRGFRTISGTERLS